MQWFYYPPSYESDPQPPKPIRTQLEDEVKSFFDRDDPGAAARKLIARRYLLLDNRHQSNNLPDLDSDISRALRGLK